MAPKRRKSVASRKVPTPEWRRFEQLVALIEHTLSPSGAVVNSPDKVVDLVTGRSREVDASIRYKVGSVPILITIECRQRGKVQDDTWIEQLAKKKEKIGAAKTIAVSSNGFTAPAIKTAEMSGIETRTITGINREDIAGWCELQSIQYTPPSITIREVHVFDKAGRDVRSDEFDTSVHESIRSLESYAPILHCERGPLTPNDIVQSWQKKFRGTQQDLNHGVEVGADAVRKAVVAPVAPNEYWVNTKRGKLFITRVALLVEVAIQIQDIPISKTYRYGAPNQAIVDGVEFVIPEFDQRTKESLRVIVQQGLGRELKATLMLGGDLGRGNSKGSGPGKGVATSQAVLGIDF